MSSLFRKFIMLLALSVAVSGTAIAKAKDDSEGKTSKLKSGLFSKKTTKNKSTKDKAATKKSTKSSVKKTTAKKSTTKKKGTKKPAISASKEQYKNITVNINKASASALSAYLVNIGPARATAIEKYRKANGKFKSIDDLKNVDGIGEKILADIKKNISLSRGEFNAPEGFKMGEINKSSTTKKTSRKNTTSKKTGSRTSIRNKKSDDSSPARSRKLDDSSSARSKKNDDSSSRDKKTTGEQVNSYKQKINR